MELLFETLRGLCASADGIAYADKDYNQIDNYALGESPSVLFPCCLIRMNMRTDTIDKHTQMCAGTITVRVADDAGNNETSSIGDDASSKASTGYYNLADSVFKKLQGYSDQYLLSLDRISQDDEVRKDGLSVVKQVYNCTFVQRTC